MNTHLQSLREILLSLESEIGQTIVGQKSLIRKIIIALFSGGHILLEGVPGLGKTKTVKTLAEVLGFEFKRISFTPDLLPSDLTGVEIYRPQTGRFEIRKGPIFTNILLADEINRTPPKVQSALLEAMEESQVTIGLETFSLPDPFFVIATENPLDHEGTYPLPEAELDRFFMKILLDYPTQSDEIEILSKTSKNQNEKKGSRHQSPIKPEELFEMRNFIVDAIHIDHHIYEYIGDILTATRAKNDNISYGASTRAGLALRDGSRICALLDGRDYVTPDDIKYISYDVLRHRIGRSYESIADNIAPDEIIREILESVKIH
ncbi:MAG: MoxR family ATPase [Candidatus Altimarinota bacterium]